MSSQASQVSRLRPSDRRDGTPIARITAMEARQTHNT
jgi:hypothetical protein